MFLGVVIDLIIFLDVVIEEDSLDNPSDEDIRSQKDRNHIDVLYEQDVYRVAPILIIKQLIEYSTHPQMLHDIAKTIDYNWIENVIRWVIVFEACTPAEDIGDQIQDEDS